MFRKFISEKLDSYDPVTQLDNPVPLPESELQPIPSGTKPLSSKAQKKAEDEEEDLFKEMEPTYAPPKRIGATMLVSDSNKLTTRFDMDVDCENSWEVDLNE